MLIYERFLHFSVVFNVCAYFVLCQRYASRGDISNEYTNLEFTTISPKDDIGTRGIEKPSGIYLPCETSNGEQGICVEIQNCPILLAATRNMSAWPFLKANKCEFRYDNPRRTRVCCGKHGNYVPSSYAVGNHLPKSCGHQNIPLNSKIFGGTDTELGEFPWMVKLIQLNKTDSTRTYGCSGFLIHPKFVVTAAHCLSRHKIVSVLVGTYSLGDYNRSNEIPVIKSIRHEEYMQSEDFFNDIAVLELMKSVNYIAQIVPVCISPETIVGDHYMISGWGQTENILASKVKLKVTIPYFDHNSCKKLYETIGKNISDKQLCAGGILNKDSCTGDSGGPLMVQINNTWYAIGVVSYGNGCGREGWPGIYTKIASYYDWINEQINASIGANLDIEKN